MLGYSFSVSAQQCESIIELQLEVISELSPISYEISERQHAIGSIIKLIERPEISSTHKAMLWETAANNFKKSQEIFVSNRLVIKDANGESVRVYLGYYLPKIRTGLAIFASGEVLRFELNPQIAELAQAVFYYEAKQSLPDLKQEVSKIIL